MLQVRGLDVFYGPAQVVSGVDIDVGDREVVTIVGANGAGKTTTLLAISGVLRDRRGEVTLAGVPIQRWPAHRIVAAGVVHIPEGRQLFPEMTVLENLELGAYPAEARARRHETLRDVFDLLPVLRDRQDQIAGSLSGGEQQMCAIGRGLMGRPRLLLLDEPTLGLAPMFSQKVFDLVRDIRDRGTSVLLVEQNVKNALSIADRAYVLENGRVVLSGPGRDLLTDPALRRAYLGL